MIELVKKKIFQIFRKHSLPRWLVLLIDLTVVFSSFLIAYMLRFNFMAYMFELDTVFNQAFIVLGVYACFMIVFKSYAGMIRHTTIRDTYKILVSGLLSVLALFVITLLSRHYEWNHLFNIPLSILLIHAGAVTVLLFLFRVFVKIFYEFATSISRDRKNVLIYGSGDLGIVVKRVIEGDPKSHYQIKGFIDDDRKIQGKKLDGYPVYSRQVLARQFFEKEDIRALIIAINRISPAKKKNVIEAVIDLGCEILDTPSFDTWLNGHLEMKNLKKVNLEDLLGREPINLDLDRIGKGLQGKTILVTGAAGSIGSEIARQIMRFETRQIILVDQAETPSFYLDQELRTRFATSNYQIIIGDVTRPEAMDEIFRKFHPEIVFHAAAYKHVPIMEVHPREAFRVNVGGTKIIVDLSVKYHVEKFVMISTDKAVNPSNVMGATKKVCELMVHSYSKQAGIKTKFITTRFGNVLGSNGSVIPLFNRQIQEGGPVTITHPDIKRYFMTIHEACQLVLEAGFMGNGGQIYVFDMGEPIRVIDIALNLIRLSGLEPYKDISIQYTGLRPGEKLLEELFSPGEKQLPTHHAKISIAEVDHADSADLIARIERMLFSLYRIPEKRLIDEMQEMVPGYKNQLELVNS
jgi:FlaA1/EpsC-like NDP-sugar epimerase